ncbi:MAG: sigma-70 family RNA polymerase sigma factor [Phycisphaera sp.]|nr:sigma-70 family RNA polymerase sigma factor [Phycisphaera sp.]
MNGQAPQPPVDATDAELLAAFAHTRSEVAFSELVRRHGGMVLSVCRSTLGNSTEAQDAAQAVFLTLAQKARDARAQHHTVGWLHRVAWHIANRAAQSRTARRRHEAEAARMRRETVVREHEPIQLDALHAGLAALPDAYRVPLILHHLEGRTHEDVAAQVGCSVNALGVRLHRGRALLRKQMERRGAEASPTALLGLWLLPSEAGASSQFIATVTKSALAWAQGQLASSAVATPVRVLVGSARRRLLWAKLKWLTVAGALLLAGGLIWTFLPRTHKQPVATPTFNLTVVTGQITRVSNRLLSLQRNTGAPVEISFDAATELRFNDAPCTVAQLQPGLDAAVYTVTGGPAQKILAYTPGSQRHP